MAVNVGCFGAEVIVSCDDVTFKVAQDLVRIEAGSSQVTLVIIPGTESDVLLHSLFETVKCGKLRADRTKTVRVVVMTPSGRVYEALCVCDEYPRMPSSLDSGRWADACYVFNIERVQYK